MYHGINWATGKIHSCLLLYAAMRARLFLDKELQFPISVAVPVVWQQTLYCKVYGKARCRDCSKQGCISAEEWIAQPLLLCLYVMVGSVSGFPASWQPCNFTLAAEVHNMQCIAERWLCTLVVAEMHNTVEDFKDARHEHLMKDFHSH